MQQFLLEIGRTGESVSTVYTGKPPKISKRTTGLLYYREKCGSVPKV